MCNKVTKWSKNRSSFWFDLRSLEGFANREVLTEVCKSHVITEVLWEGTRGWKWEIVAFYPDCTGRKGINEKNVCWGCWSYWNGVELLKCSLWTFQMSSLFLSVEGARREVLQSSPCPPMRSHYMHLLSRGTCSWQPTRWLLQMSILPEFRHHRIGSSMSCHASRWNTLAYWNRKF